MIELWMPSPVRKHAATTKRPNEPRILSILHIFPKKLEESPIDCNLHCYCGEPRVASSFPSIIQSLPHHLPLRHLCQAPGSNHQRLFSVAEIASIRVHLFLSSSDPELIQTHPSNLLMTNLPRTSLIIAKFPCLPTYLRSKLFLRKFPP